jgi:hypothetical protein
MGYGVHVNDDAKVQFCVQGVSLRRRGELTGIVASAATNRF